MYPLAIPAARPISDKVINVVKSIFFLKV